MLANNVLSFTDSIRVFILINETQQNTTEDIELTTSSKTDPGFLLRGKAIDVMTRRPKTRLYSQRQGRSQGEGQRGQLPLSKYFQLPLPYKQRY